MFIPIVFPERPSTQTTSWGGDQGGDPSAHPQPRRPTRSVPYGSRPPAQGAGTGGRGSAPRRPSVRGGPSPARCHIPGPMPGGRDPALVPRPPPRGSAEKAPGARPAGLYPPSPAGPVPNAVTHPRPPGPAPRATTHPTAPGRGKLRAAEGGASPDSEAARPLRQVSSAWTLLL